MSHFEKKKWLIFPTLLVFATSYTCQDKAKTSAVIVTHLPYKASDAVISKFDRNQRQLTVNKGKSWVQHINLNHLLQKWTVHQKICSHLPCLLVDKRVLYNHSKKLLKTDWIFIIIIDCSKDCKLQTLMETSFKLTNYFETCDQQKLSCVTIKIFVLSNNKSIILEKCFVNGIKLSIYRSVFSPIYTKVMKA